MSAKIIAFVNSKGGVGRTTLVIQLAWQLTTAGSRVLVIDNDPRCNLTRLIWGMEYLRTKWRGYLGLLYENRPGPPPERVIHETRFHNLHLIPATPGLATHDRHDGRLHKPPNRFLLKLVGRIKFRYDFILIDCPAWNGPLSEAALAAADAAIIPVRVGDIGTIGLHETLALVEEVRSRFNPRLQLCGIVATMRDARSKVIPKHEAQLRSAHGDLVFPAAIPSLSAIAKEPTVGRDGRMKFDREGLRDPRPDVEVFTNEILSRMGSPKRIFGGKVSTLTVASADGCPNGATEAPSRGKHPSIPLGEVELDPDAEC